MITESEFERLNNKIEDVAKSVYMHHQFQVRKFVCTCVFVSTWVCVACMHAMTCVCPWRDGVVNRLIFQHLQPCFPNVYGNSRSSHSSSFVSLLF